MISLAIHVAAFGFLAYVAFGGLMFCFHVVDSLNNDARRETPEQQSAREYIETYNEVMRERGLL